MTFKNDEKRLLILCCSGSIDETADALRLVLCDTTDPDERAAASGALRKLGCMGENAFRSFVLESEGIYD